MENSIKTRISHRGFYQQWAVICNKTIKLIECTSHSMNMPRVVKLIEIAQQFAHNGITKFNFYLLFLIYLIDLVYNLCLYFLRQLTIFSWYNYFMLNFIEMKNLLLLCRHRLSTLFPFTQSNAVTSLKFIFLLNYIVLSICVHSQWHGSAVEVKLYEGKCLFSTLNWDFCRGFLNVHIMFSYQ